MYILLGICLALAAFLTLNAVASMAASFAWRTMNRMIGRWSARSRAEILFALRLAPPALALIFISLFFLPAYVGYEPRATSEVVSIKLAAFALLSAFGVAFAINRACRSYLATRALRRQWLAVATEIRLPGIDVPAFRIAHSFPIIAVIGTIRPRLFIANQVLQSLSAEELAAAIAHECGHLAARDNLKRGLLGACRDALMIAPFGRSLDRAWAETAEAAADEHAAQTSPAVALNLASALVRIARMIPVGIHAELPLAAFLVGDETRGVKARVRRLLELASSNGEMQPRQFAFGRIIPLLALALLITVGVALATNSSILLEVHSIVERVVSLLS
jgi:Zn-dependent protease with chaperone function